MAKLKKGMNPTLFILIVAVVCVAITMLVIYMIGLRYITYDGGYKFYGKTENGLPYSGTIRYPNGESAELDMANKTIRYSNGDLYVGDIYQVYRQGNGKMSFYATKDVYEGQFQEDKLTGTGTYTYRNGDVFMGKLIDSQKQGQAVFIWADGSKYEGGFENGVQNGYGVFTNGKDGSKYEGNFKNGVKDGEGTYYFANGDYYKGMFSADKRTGTGFYRWANKETYTGTFHNSMLDTRLKNENGEFVLDSNGNYIHGQKAVYTWPSGRSYTGYFEEGRIVTIEDTENG